MVVHETYIKQHLESIISNEETLEIISKKNIKKLIRKLLLIHTSESYTEDEQTLNYLLICYGLKNAIENKQYSIEPKKPKNCNFYIFNIFNSIKLTDEAFTEIKNQLKKLLKSEIKGPIIFELLLFIIYNICTDEAEINRTITILIDILFGKKPEIQDTGRIEEIEGGMDSGSFIVCILLSLFMCCNAIDNMRGLRSNIATVTAVGMSKEVVPTIEKHIGNQITKKLHEIPVIKVIEHIKKHPMPKEKVYKLMTNVIKNPSASKVSYIRGYGFGLIEGLLLSPRHFFSVIGNQITHNTVERDIHGYELFARLDTLTEADIIRDGINNIVSDLRHILREVIQDNNGELIELNRILGGIDEESDYNGELETIINSVNRRIHNMYNRDTPRGTPRGRHRGTPRLSIRTTINLGGYKRKLHNKTKKNKTKKNKNKTKKKKIKLKKIKIKQKK